MSYQIWVGEGNLTDDPKMNYVGTSPKTTFSIAINEKRGEKEEVFYADVEAWDKNAENVAEYKRKGDAVLVQGRWKRDSWDDKETGAKRYKYYVRADVVKFVGGPRDMDEQRPQRRAYKEPKNDGEQYPF